MGIFGGIQNNVQIRDRASSHVSLVSRQRTVPSANNVKPNLFCNCFNMFLGVSSVVRMTSRCEKASY